MATVGSAYMQIVPSMQGVGPAISKQLGGPSAKAGKESGLKIASSIKGVLAAAGIGAALTAGIKVALDEGGKLQQSFGGLETIYGDAAEAAKKYAQEAAQVGISANSYAEQAVSFGASLKQAFGGDTTKAVEAANTAIMDMTDNAAKMGTPIENIQNAYQGFAKQNYTMLDNLKLGYGGTKTEMERLLADATKLSGVEYNIDNLGDVYDAIHVIQEDLGLTGVAAQEASETFSGSFGAMKASASNLAAALTTGGDVQAAMSNLITNIGTFVGGNLIPMLGNLFTALPGALSTAFTMALPVLQMKGPEIINRIGSGISAALPLVLAKGKELLTMLGTGITQNLPTLLEKGRQLIVGLFTGFRAALPEIGTAAAELITGLSDFITANLPTIGEQGGKMLTALAANIIASIPEVVSAVVKLIPAIAKGLGKLRPAAIKAAVQMLAGLMSGIETGTSSAVSKAKAAAAKIVDGIKEKLKPVADKGKEAMNKLKDKVVTIGNQIYSKAKSIFDKVKEAISGPIEKAKGLVQNALNAIRGLFPLNLGHIINFQIPTISLRTATASVLGKSITYPTGFDVGWHAKAMDNPYLFNRATLFGAGEAGDEMLYGRQNLMRDIREATRGSGENNITINVTVNGAENPEQWGQRLARELQMQMRTA